MQLTFEEELTMHTCPSGHERCTCKTLEGGGHQMKVIAQGGGKVLRRT